jgi:chromosome segregation ATPase
VGSVPCLINFYYENEYSWFREKVVSYKVTVTPPSKESLTAGRRRRAKACLKAVDEDLKSAQKRLASASDQRATIEEELEALQKRLEEKQKSLQVIKTEEKWLKERVGLRKEQHGLLQVRLADGWEDDGQATQKKQMANGK